TSTRSPSKVTTAGTSAPEVSSSSRPSSIEISRHEVPESWSGSAGVDGSRRSLADEVAALVPRSPPEHPARSVARHRVTTVARARCELMRGSSPPAVRAVRATSDGRAGAHRWERPPVACLAMGRTRVGYLGPEGTFSEQALLDVPDLAGAERVPLPLMTDVLFAVHEGRVDLGVVPVENAIEGSVNAIVDTLAFDVDLLIQREIVEPVSLNLLVRPGTRLEDVERIVAIPVASSQCRRWLRSNLPSVAHVAASSNAEAARLVATGDDPAAAAIANPRAAEVYGLEVAASEIEDHPENQTRFVVVARSGVPARTGHDKTSIVVFQRSDRPGSLLAILQEFAARSINLSLLLPRPAKTPSGVHIFCL